MPRGDDDLGDGCGPGEQLETARWAKGDAGGESDGAGPEDRPRFLRLAIAAGREGSAAGLPWTMRKTQLPC